MAEKNTLRTIRFPTDDYEEIKTASKLTGIPFNRLVAEGALKHARFKRNINKSPESSDYRNY